MGYEATFYETSQPLLFLYPLYQKVLRALPEVMAASKPIKQTKVSKSGKKKTSKVEYSLQTPAFL